MEVPQQYHAIKRLLLLSQGPASAGELRAVPAPLQPPTNDTYQRLSRNLPSDWICTWSPQAKRHYYLNWERQQTQWEKPSTVQVGQKRLSKHSGSSTASTTASS